MINLKNREEMQHLFGTLHSHGTSVQIPAKWDRLGGHTGRSIKVFFFFVFFALGRCNNNDESHRAII